MRRFSPQRLLVFKSINWLSLAGCLLLTLVAGCFTEVPYIEEGGKGDDAEIDGGELDGSELDDREDNDLIGDQNEAFDQGSSNEFTDAPLADSQPLDEPSGQVLDETNSSEKPKSLLPWQTVSDSDETPDLFSKNKSVTPESIEPEVEEAVTPNETEEPEDEFGSFLAEQYEGLLDTQPVKEEPAKKLAVESKPAAPTMPEQRYGYQPSPQAGTLKIPDLKRPPSNRQKAEDLTASLPDEETGDFLFDPIEAEPTEIATTEVKPVANAPAPVESLPVDQPKAEPIAAAPEKTLMPWEQPTANTPDVAALPTEPVVKDRYQDDLIETNPLETFDEPMEPFEPTNAPLATLTPKAPTIVETESTRLASLDPLPAVPVLRYNTRHMAWLLGGKLGLARLAELEGATPIEISQWDLEVKRLAKQLKVPIPQVENNSDSVGQRVKALLDAAAEASDSVASEHGSDHAALLEISLKTNALLVMCKKYPELAAPTAKAVESAAERAELPGFLWRSMTKALLADSTPDEIFDAVTQMHDSVESYLR